MIIEQPRETGQPRRKVWCSINEITAGANNTYTFNNVPQNALGYGSIVYVIDEPGLVLYYDNTNGTLYKKAMGVNSSVLDFKGSVATVSDLPTTGMKKGDIWIVIADSSEWVWTSDSDTGTLSDYEELGPVVDLSGYLQIADLADATGSSTTTAMTQKAVTDALGGLIKTATGTIGTSATSVVVSYTGTIIATRTTDGNGNEVITEVDVDTSSVTFTTSAAPSAAITCTVVYF